MPFRSDKQRKYIHAQAARGVKWAQKFVKDSGESKDGEDRKAKAVKHAKKRAAKKR